MYLFVAAVVLSGCGVLNKQELQPTVPTLTHGWFVYLGDRVCRRDLRRAKRAFRPKPTNQLLFDLRALAPPTSQADSYRELLAAYNYVDLLCTTSSRLARTARPRRSRRSPRSSPSTA